MSYMRAFLLLTVCFIALICIGMVQAFFVPVTAKAHPATPSSTSRLSMGLFDWKNDNIKDRGGKTWTREGGKRVYRGMSKTEEAKRKQNTYQGEKITVREDEDAAMWIDDKDRHTEKSNTDKKGWFG